MDLLKFTADHKPALERDEVRHGLILNALAQVDRAISVELSRWTLGGPGECAIKAGQHSIVLGVLGEDQCRRLAELTADSDHPGVIGPDLTARWFTDRARELGLQFLKPVQQRIYSISDTPRYPGSPGHARLVTIGDANLLADWLLAFHQEAAPHDPIPSREELERAAREERFLFWIVDGKPVSMAGIVRRLKTSVAITGVYTALRIYALDCCGGCRAGVTAPSECQWRVGCAS